MLSPDPLAKGNAFSNLDRKIGLSRYQIISKVAEEAKVKEYVAFDNLTKKVNINPSRSV